MGCTSSKTSADPPKPFTPQQPGPVQPKSRPGPQQQPQPQQQQGPPRGGQMGNRGAQPAYGRDGYTTVGQLSEQEGTTMKLMQNKKTKERVASKWIARVQGQGLPKNVEREIVNHRKLLHPNIIRFYEVFMTDDSLVIVMEYATGGPLQDRIRTNGRLQEAEAKKFYGQLTEGLAYCHQQGIFHRALRMENLLLQGNYYDSVLKISNFGYSKHAMLDSVAKTVTGGAHGQILYSPPELLLGNTSADAYDAAAVDVWCTGIILFNMLTGQMPFLDPEMPNVMNAKVNQRIAQAKWELPADVTISRECHDLLSKIFVSNPKTRIKTPQVQQHPWLSGAELAASPKAAVQTLPPISSQTEDDIRAVVERARQRRAASKQNMDGGQRPAVPPANGLANGAANARPLRSTGE